VWRRRCVWSRPRNGGHRHPGGGIAHDLNNILTPILGYTQLMLQMLADGESVDSDMLDQILVSGKGPRKRLAGFSHSAAIRRQSSA